MVDSRLRTLVNKPFAHSRYELEPSSDKLRFKTGRPGRLRSDPSWKTLTIIRQSVRQMGAVDRKALQTSLTSRADGLPSKQLEELLPLMEVQWSDLYGQDEYGLPKVPPILRSQFPLPGSSTSPLHFRGIVSATCPHAKVILQSYGADYNELVLSDLTMNLRASTMSYKPFAKGLATSSTVTNGEKALHVVGAIA
ncbi:hypothetical protein FRC07_009329, partial [Ceratobasidium sp. 392]